MLDQDTLPAAQRAALEHAYEVPRRAYHHFGHVQEVLGHYQQVWAGPGWQQPVEVGLAVLYHDAIYEPGRNDNESRSAALVLDHLRRWPRPGVDAARAAALIQLTAQHGKLAAGDLTEDPCPDDAMLFLDCEMAILGAEQEVFDRYDEGIAEEYRGHVPGLLYRINRRRFLKGLLSRPRIFLSDWFHHKLDEKARANLRRALARSAR